ncbi:MAG: hypothetical protein A3C58_01605 [Candidatus Staskawiczbacteria bacterium RIFCSPHIGHO2_02_FULL_34_10]|uniref:GIY-YIG domain-containing protein n=1 Tax=Candidatus Staskawiczbacteria bacterium RIFCSPHIGHO2_02_FULL_34_10 TaxID=1802205 RepID=A0A1G2HWL4_9BACT|nr:MAG: hypothetical protein A3C58_01605 [Candidatus Staskawiczbacteria bacterium RIFCSPHIGHO2_02_FULL_34_10]
MFYIYVTQSLKDNRTYVGYTNNLERRLIEHDSGQNKSTKKRIPFKLLFSEKFETSQKAKKRELYWKNGAGRRKLKKMFNDELPPYPLKNLSSNFHSSFQGEINARFANCPI